MGLVSVLGSPGRAFNRRAGSPASAGSAETTTRAGRRRRPFRIQPCCTTCEHGMCRMLGRGLHGHRLVPGRVERLPGRIDRFEARALEGLQQQPQHRVLALGQRRRHPRSRRTPAPSPSVSTTGRRSAAKAFDAELARQSPLRARRACGRSRARRWPAGSRARCCSARRLGVGQQRFRRRASGDCPSSGPGTGCSVSVPFMRVGSGAQSREFKAEPSIRAAMSTTGMTRS